jgi:hypothetical protein
MALIFLALVCVIVPLSLALASSASACVKPVTYTQKLHNMAHDVRAHGKPCSVEDGSEGPLPCYWDAAHMGNGKGNSFVILNGGILGDYQRVIFVYDSGAIVRDGWAL